MGIYYNSSRLVPRPFVVFCLFHPMYGYERNAYISFRKSIQMHMFVLT